MTALDLDFVPKARRKVASPGPVRSLDKMTMLQGQKHNVDAEKLQACIKAQDEGAVKASMKEGDGIGVSATPTLFINGQKIDGAVPINDVRAALDRALKVQSDDPAFWSRLGKLYASILFKSDSERKPADLERVNAIFKKAAFA